MKHISIKDNSSYSLYELEEINEIVDTVCDKTLNQLQKEGIFVFPETLGQSDDLTDDQMILQRLNNRILSSNVMGILGIHNQRLSITSRFSIANEDYLFKYLLERVFDFPNIIDLKVTGDKNNQMFNMLLFLFPFYLKKAMRKGIYKRYKTKHYNDSNVKGSIDIARHIKKNIPFTGNIAYSNREYEYDNEVMLLIRHTIDFIKRKSFGNMILQKANHEVKKVIEVTKSYKSSDKRNIILFNKKNIVNHSYYIEYRPLQILCLLILQYQKEYVGTGINQLHGILFDGAWLWEEYINLLIGDNYYHPKNKNKKGFQYLFDKSRGKIYPDFISIDSNKRTICDAKYKPINNIHSKDYLQMLAYMFRFEAKEGIFVFPETSIDLYQEMYLNKGTSFEDNITVDLNTVVRKCGLQIPIANSYDEFVSLIKVNEKDFLDRLYHKQSQEDF